MSPKKGTELLVEQGPARPSKLTEERIEAIVNAVAVGTHYVDAAILAGIDRSTLYRWLKRATAAEHLNTNEQSLPQRRALELRDGITRAEAEYRRNAEASIDIAATIGRTVTTVKEVAGPNGTTTTTTSTQVLPDWRARAWRLERRWPERYGPNASVEVTGQGGGAIAISLEDVISKADAIRARHQSESAGTRQPEADAHTPDTEPEDDPE